MSWMTRRTCCNVSGSTYPKRETTGKPGWRAFIRDIAGDAENGRAGDVAGVDGRASCATEVEVEVARPECPNRDW